MPHEEREHDVVVPPEIPVTEQAFLFGPGAQVPVFVLKRQELVDCVANGILQAPVVAHPKRLNGRDEVLADELASPWY
jgi:hypothetical protein